MKATPVIPRKLHVFMPKVSLEDKKMPDRVNLITQSGKNINRTDLSYFTRLSCRVSRTSPLES